MSALTYKVEPLTLELGEELLEMSVVYWKEVAQPFHDFPPRVDWETYGNLAKQGKLCIVVGRDQKGVARGFSFAVIAKHIHYDCIAAKVPLLFLHPDYRKGREGIRLIRAVEKAARERGAQLFSTHGGMHNGVNRLFEALGYKDFGRYYVKTLEAR